MRKIKVYKCPICKRTYKTFEGWENHIKDEHPEAVPKDMTMKQYLYYILTGKTAGVCMVCKKPTPWNESTCRYDRFCTNPKCKEKYRETFKKRMINKYGKVMLLNDPDVQRQMLANRKISGKYKFEDWVVIPYVGSYEKDFLRMLDTFMHVHGSDIMGPSPHTYNYDYKNSKDKEHEGEKFYIPDFFIPSLSLEIEIKDTTTTHHKFIDVDQVKEAQKDEVMKNIKGIRYFKVTNKNYADFFDYILSLKEEPEDDISKIKEVVYDKAVESYMSTVSKMEPANEALFLSSEDIYIKYDEWGKSSENNMLFITGFSGSGKSTLGSKIAKEHDAVYCNIDYFHSGRPDLSDPFIKDIFDRCPEYKKYCKEVVEGTSQPYTSESFKLLQKIIAAMIESAENHYPNKKYVIEGFQLYAYCPAEYILDKPLIVKGTSALKSLLQRLKRDNEHILHLNPIVTYLQIMRYYKWYVSDNTKIKKLIQTIKNK